MLQGIRRAAWGCVGVAVGVASAAHADDDPVAVHGFVSQGGFVSTDNDYIGESSRGSLSFFEVGDFETDPRIDWAFVDYAWRPWLGIRAGTIKIPLGLYNEFVDIDAARLPILLPQGVYSLRNRDAITSYTGVGAYGERELSCHGTLEYRAWLGTLTISENALQLAGATLDDIDVRYATGGHVFWATPVDGLRVGGSYTRAAIDFDLQLSPELTAAVIAAGLAPADYDGDLLVAQRPTHLIVGSVEYTRGAWLLVAEYARRLQRQSYLPALVPTEHRDSEAFYAMAAYRHDEHLELGAYGSVLHANSDDRMGRDLMPAQRHHAFQRDYAAIVRYDVNDHWTWKAEAHVIDGTADLDFADRMTSERFWGLFLFKTTVTF
jgi:hypothetical protein